ncbi:Fizzy-related protein [Thelohanellus kitauei]|uniref:Fizzy-related protein n=1 Tax=Thelohanellus kitauei TaxID=669202 RepID=A0A0C2MDW3_THEKT|nr:Fizzy-related protein [Thelohanellus kitauei]
MNIHKSPLRSDLTSENTPPLKRELAFSDRFISSQTRRALDFSAYTEPDHPVPKEVGKNEPSTTAINNPESTSARFMTISEKQYNIIYKSILTNELTDGQYENEPSSDKSEFDEMPVCPPSVSYKRFIQSEASAFSATPSSPFSQKSQKVLKQNFYKHRKISNFPYKVLDAPGLPNDFYQNVLDWSKNDLIAVALINKIYLWDSTSSRVINVNNKFHIENNITSVKWCKDYVSCNINSAQRSGLCHH